MACQYSFIASAEPTMLRLCTSDIDFEYPSNAAEGQGFADLLTELRTAFDNLAASRVIPLHTNSQQLFLQVQTTTPTLSFLRWTKL